MPTVNHFNLLHDDAEEPPHSQAGMEGKYPKRLFRDGNEPQADKINNSCKMTLLIKIKEALPLEYDEVKRDPVFAHVFAIHENGLGYSARAIHNILCRQLVTKKKHELWFVFGRKPLRFSLQEFHAVTWFNCKDDGSDFEKWTDDKGFWSKLLKRKENIRQRVAVDLWEAASDPVFIERMSKYEPPQLDSDIVDID